MSRRSVMNIVKRCTSTLLTGALIFTSLNINILFAESNNMASIKDVTISDSKKTINQQIDDNLVNADKFQAATGYIDSGIDYDRIPDKNLLNTPGLDMATTLPSTYSSVDKGYVTSIKNQNPWGTCWAFAAVAAMESYALAHGIVDDPADINLSEYALVYLTNNDDKLVYDETGDYTYSNDPDYGFDYGGNDEMAFKSLSNGTALYDDDALESLYKEAENGNISPLQWDKNNISYILTGQYYIDMMDMEQVKAAVMEHGAVTTSYFSHKDYANHSVKQYLYNYNYENEATNHAVAIVGWDDTIPASNFSVVDSEGQPRTPSRPGGWLIKNSWGEYAGDNGYIWISYEDMGILSADAVVYAIAKKSDYPITYQHDGATTAIISVNLKEMANVFTVDGSEQIINAVSFFTRDVCREYTVSVYDNTNGGQVDKGRLVATASGTTTYAGYYTVNLDNSYVFPIGSTFSVVLEFDKSSSVLIGYAEFAVGAGVTVSTSKEGQTYYSYGGEFYDFAIYNPGYKNITLKAHAKSVGTSNVATKINNVTMSGKDRVTIKWEEVDGASYYELWKCDSATGTGKVISNITDTTYTDINVPSSNATLDKIDAGKTYYYKVKPVVEGKNCLYSAVKNITIMPEKVNPVLTVTEDNKLSVTWDKVSFADGYDIFIGIDNVDDMNVVATVDSNSTSFTYNEKMYCGCYYYVEVKAYIINSAGQKVYGLSNTAFERIEIGTVSGNSYEYSVEDTVTVRWTDNNDGIYDGVFANIYYGNSFKKRVYIDKGETSYDFDIAGATVGGSVSIDIFTYVNTGDGSLNSTHCFEINIQVKKAFDEPVFWYVVDDTIHIIMPEAIYAQYQLYGYNENDDTYEHLCALMGVEVREGCAIVLDEFTDFSRSKTIKISGDPYIFSKEYITVGGEYKAPVIEYISDVKLGQGVDEVELNATISNKMPGFYYQYQWYQSDTKTGEAIPIEGATKPSYTAYVDSWDAKYYYCQVTCMYNGTNTYCTSNGEGERTRVAGYSYIGDITISDIADQTYTGNAIKPTFTVRNGNTVLTLGTDYTVTYSGNVNVGTASVDIRFIGSYTSLGTITKDFVIKPVNGSALTVSYVNSYRYTGYAITPILTIKYGDITLQSGIDYTVQFANNVNAGTATITITCVGNYSGTVTKNFTITKVTSSYVTANSIPTQIYTGNAIKPSVILKYGSIQLKEGIDFTVTYSNNTNVGTANYTVTLQGNYSGTINGTFGIGSTSIALLSIPTIPDQIYTGSEIKVYLTIKSGNTTLRPGFDYTLSYTNNINVGTATVTITGKGNYNGTQTKTYKITPVSCEMLGVSGVQSSYTYTGTAMTPTITLSNGNTKLENGKDYTVSYANNKNAGTATVTITGKGNYTGTIVKTFVINQMSIQSVSVGQLQNQTYTGNAITPEVTLTNGSVKLIKGTDYTVAYSNNVNAGTGIVTITGVGNYKDTISTTFIISDVPSKITSPTFNVADTSNHISKITSGTNVNSLVSSLNENQYISIYKGSAKVTGTSLIGTGMFACIMNGGNITRKYALIVTGDTSGDGKINITDMIAVKAHILKKSTLTDVYAKAGDVNGDGKINITDFIKIKATLLGKDSIKGVSAN